VSHFILHSTPLLAFRASGGGWIHTVAESGTVASWRLCRQRQGANRDDAAAGDKEDVPPLLLIVPDLRKDLGGSLRCATAIGKEGFLVVTLDARAFITLPPATPLVAPAPPCILRVQALVRRNLVLCGLDACRVLLPKQAEMRNALAAAALIEFGHAERLMLLSRDLAKLVTQFVGSNVAAAFKDLADIHLGLGSFLAQSAQVTLPWLALGTFLQLTEHQPLARRPGRRLVATHLLTSQW
jgi:hypothetical protein